MASQQYRPSHAEVVAEMHRIADRFERNTGRSADDLDAEGLAEAAEQALITRAAMQAANSEAA